MTPSPQVDLRRGISASVFFQLPPEAHIKNPNTCNKTVPEGVMQGRNNTYFRVVWAISWNIPFMG